MLGIGPLPGLPTMPRELPVFPLGTVLYPGALLRLNIFEPRYRAMTRHCVDTNTGFGVFLIEGGYEVGTPAIPHRHGCEAQLVDAQQRGDGTWQLLVRGHARLRLAQRRVQDDGLIVGEVETLPTPDPMPLPDRHARLAELLSELQRKFAHESPLPTPLRLDDASWIAYRWAELLPLTPEMRVRWLAIDDPIALIDAVAAEVADALR